MRQSQLFTKTRKEAPKDEVSKNAQLLIRAGYIHKEMAGVYALLPLGLRVFNNIVKIIREEMNAIGGQELTMTALQDPSVWMKTKRWGEAVDVWFTTQLKSGSDLGLAFTHEEPLTALMTEYVSSYKDLPSYVYQFQTKFRNETRAKSGIMRTREFVMKDLYSFSKDAKEHEVFYEKAAHAYETIFRRVGLGDKTYKTFASGGSFSKYSHEYQTVCEAGEDIIYIDDASGQAINKEVYDDPDVYVATGVTKETLREAKSIEVGNIFTLGTRYAEALNLVYKNEKGENVPVYMGSYGIGPARLMGTIVELLSDEKGIVWPESVAPFRVHLIELANGNTDVTNDAQEVYDELTRAGVEVLWDDRDARAGEKFADSDLLGLPWRVVVSEKTLQAGTYECVARATGKVAHLSLDALLKEASS